MLKKTFDHALLLIGACVFLFSVSLDYLFQGSPGIGFGQFSGMVVGTIVMAMALRFLLLEDRPLWDGLLFFSYLIGLLIVGLRPSSVIVASNPPLFGTNIFSLRDTIVNICGFVPLGFIALSFLKYYINGYSHRKQNVVAIAIGLLVSITIETLQHYGVPGRFSSAFDLIANSVGAFVGARLHQIFKPRACQ